MQLFVKFPVMILNIKRQPYNLIEESLEQILVI